MNIPKKLIDDARDSSQRIKELTRIARQYIAVPDEDQVSPEISVDNKNAQSAFVDSMNVLLSFRSVASGKSLADAPSLLIAFTSLIFGLQLNPFWQRAQGLLNPAFVAAAQGLLDSYQVTEDDIIQRPEMVWSLSHGHLELASLFIFAALDHATMVKRSLDLRRELEKL